MNRKQTRALLRDYAAGKVPRAQAIARLGLKNYRQLLDLLEKEGIEGPRVAAHIEKQMARSLREVFLGGEPLEITAAEFRRHFDFILDILPWERRITIRWRGRAVELLSALDHPDDPGGLDTSSILREAIHLYEHYVAAARRGRP